MPVESDEQPRPLAGIRVLDFTRVLAGPSCTRILCDLGADVIKVEPPEGDLSRRLGGRRGGISSYYMQQNCGKRNLSIDLRTASGRELAARLAAHCDVLVENYRPGVMESLDLGPQRLLEASPRLIYCAISGFGRSGPWADQRAFAGIAHATTGILHRQAAATQSEPSDSVLALGDTVAGLQSVIAILAALEERRRSGRGQLIDMAMHDALLAIQEAANFYLFNDDGRDTDYLCAWVYRCGEEHVVIPHDPRAYWKELTAVMQRPELLADEKYDSFEKRSQRLDELEALLQDWVAGFDGADAVVAALHAGGLPGARLMRLGEALDCEQSQARDMTPRIDDRSGRRTRVLNTPYRYSRSVAGVRGVPAFRGEHNREVLGELLGLSAEEIARLEDSAVISSRLPKGS